jgi:hypothetical protein
VFGPLYECYHCYVMCETEIKKSGRNVSLIEGFTVLLMDKTFSRKFLN